MLRPMSTPADSIRASLLISFCALGFISQTASSAGTDAGGYEVIANAFGFGIDIPGCADASKNIREIQIDQTTIDVREMTTGLDVEYRLYGPGAAHWGQARFTSAITLGGSKELQAWFQEAAKGKNIRKNITVTLFKSDKTPGRRYNLFDCFPTQWREDVDSSGVPVETVEVEIGRIEFASAAIRTSGLPVVSPNTDSGFEIAAEATVSDKFAQVRGFKVEIDGASGKEVDTAWESVSGGELIIELTETTIGSDKFQTTSPGHKSVNSVTLRGAMTDKRAALCQWMNDTTQGRNWRRNMQLTEVLLDDSDGVAHAFSLGFPVRYVYPRMSVYNRAGNAEETIEFHAIRDNPDLRGVAFAAIDIEEAPLASEKALLLAIEDLNIDVARLVDQKDARSVTATIAIPAGAGEELAKWLAMAEVGLPAARRIEVVLYSRDGSLLHALYLIDCLPVSLDRSAETQTETLTVKIGRIEFKT
jgi:hypothetical protein